MSHARVAVGRIDAGMSSMQDMGGLQFFNSEFKRRRISAQATGARFMSYNEAKATLQAVLAGIAAADGGAPADIIEQDLEQEKVR
jgi:hypothetical protein